MVDPVEFSLENASGLFLTDFQKRSDNMYNSDNLLDGRIKKRYDFVGADKKIETHLSFAGGVGSGKLPLAGTARYKKAVITSNKVYGRAQVEREAIHASANDKGAFRRAMSEVSRKTVESFMRNNSRILFGDSTGIIGKGIGAGPTDVTGLGTVASPYIVEFTSATFKEAAFEEEDLVQMVTGLDAANQGGTMEGSDSTTNLLLVDTVIPETFVVKLIGTSAVLAAHVAAPTPLAATDGICMQRSYLREPQGLKGVLTPYAGTTELYGIAVQRRWQSFSKDAAGVGITTDLMNLVMLQVEKRFKQVPKIIITGYAQYQNFLALLEDQKRYDLGNTNLVKGKELKGRFSFTGVEFMSTRGPVGVFADRFCEDDRVYFLNEKYITRHHRPGFGWFKEDGTIFMRVQEEDAYEARYGGYCENEIVPTAHGVLFGLAV